jgi:hypothetical protein
VRSTEHKALRRETYERKRFYFVSDKTNRKEEIKNSVERMKEKRMMIATRCTGYSQEEVKLKTNK